MTSIQPHQPIDWEHIEQNAERDCPSPFFRHEARRILQRVELIGPLRPPADEFRRVYRSLHWNEPDRVLEVVNALLPRVKGPNPKIVVRAEAWGYVVGVLDEWITQARIFYLASGILECSLRARLHGRMTDVTGTTNWPEIDGAAPSQLHEFAAREARDGQLARVHELVEAFKAGLASPAEHAGLVVDLDATLQPTAVPAPRDGAVFVRDLTFGGLRMFFERKASWGGKYQLQEIFRGRNGTATLPNRDKVTAVLKNLNAARNDASHYRPKKYPTFDGPLFDAANLAAWLGEDLQHIYSSIDTRQSTELSTLLIPIAEDAGWLDREDGSRCAANGCATRSPMDWLMDRAPLAREEVNASFPVTRSCLHHRVVIRVQRHRPYLISGEPPSPGVSR